MFAAALPVGLSFIGLFSPPSGLGRIGLFLWLTAFAVLTRSALTLYNVPHMAVGAEITESSAERIRLIVLRQFFSYAGTTFATVVQGVFTAFAPVAYYAMMTDVTDAHELETGARREGTLARSIPASGCMW